jgi:phosphate transport system substrate-binding protein
LPRVTTGGKNVTRKLLAISLAASIAGALATTPALAQSARDSINIVGSSTVYPFTTTVAEQFGRAGQFKTPKVESTGTGGGIKLFCNGVGPQFPDIANASRRMNANELATCQKNGVKDVVEIKVGYDGIVLAQSKAGNSLNLTRKEVYLALARRTSTRSCRPSRSKCSARRPPRGPVTPSSSCTWKLAAARSHG